MNNIKFGINIHRPASSYLALAQEIKMKIKRVEMIKKTSVNIKGINVQYCGLP